MTRRTKNGNLIRLFAGVVAALMLLLAFPQYAFAGYTTNFTNSEAYLRTSYDADNYMAFSINDKVLTAQGRLRLNNLDSIMLYYNTKKSKASASGGKDFTVSMELDHGSTLYIDVYTHAKNNETYWSYIWDTICIERYGSNYRIKPSLIEDYNEKIYTAYMEPDNYKNAQNIDKSVKEQANAIVKGVSGDYEKVYRLYKWVVENIYYDCDQEELSTINILAASKDTLQYRRGVCEGYANLLRDLIISIGIPAACATDYVLGGDAKAPTFANKSQEVYVTLANHMHVEAYVDGRWIIMDPTWDSPNEYSRGEYTTGIVSPYLYFDVTPEFFSMNHKYISRANGRITMNASGNIVGADVPKTVTAVPSGQKLNINGVELSNIEIYNIGGNNYFKLRDIAKLLTGTGAQFSVSYSIIDNTIAISTGRPYSAIGGELSPKAQAPAQAIRSSQAVKLDGQEKALIAYNINGNNYFKLRDLGGRLNFSVDYDEKTNTILITTPQNLMSKSDDSPSLFEWPRY